jgi:hypothetical protein
MKCEHVGYLVLTCARYATAGTTSCQKNQTRCQSGYIFIAEAPKMLTSEHQLENVMLTVLCETNDIAVTDFLQKVSKMNSETSDAIT